MCDLCDRSFSRKDRLKSHRKAHSGVPDLLNEAAGAFRQPAHHQASLEDKKAKRPRRASKEAKPDDNDEVEPKQAKLENEQTQEDGLP